LYSRTVDVPTRGEMEDSKGKLKVTGDDCLWENPESPCMEIVSRIALDLVLPTSGL